MRTVPHFESPTPFSPSVTTHPINSHLPFHMPLSEHDYNPALSPEERLYKAREYAALEHHRIMLAITTPTTIHLSPTAPVSSLTNLANLSIFNRIYIGSVQFDLSEDDVREAFSVYGPVKSVTMMMDNVAKRHRGYGFVEFETPEAANLALQCMDNAIFGQRHMRCGRPNNYPSELPPNTPKPPPERLYVSNVHELIGEEELEKVFGAFGPLKACRLAPDFETRRHRGFGYVEFEQAEHAALALTALHRFELAGRALQVGKCIVGGPLMGGMSLLSTLKSAIKIPGDKHHLLPPSVLAAADSINATVKEITKTSPRTSTVVRISNLDDYAVISQSEQDQQDLEGDVRGECSKYGHLDSSKFVLAAPNTVSIFLKYSKPEEAAECIRVMQGRWFGGRQLVAIYFDPERYESRDFLD